MNKTKKKEAILKLLGIEEYLVRKETLDERIEIEGQKSEQTTFSKLSSI